MSANKILLLYFKSIVKNILTSPEVYLGILFIGGVLGYIGAKIANVLPPLWFSITYLLLAFSIAGGISRSIAIGSGALSYLIKNAGLNPFKLVLTLILASIVIQLSIFPVFMILISFIYYIFDKIILMISNVELMMIGIVLAALLFPHLCYSYTLHL